MSTEQLQSRVDAAFANRELLTQADYRAAVEETIAELDAGRVRSASCDSGEWVTHPWVGRAILMYFGIRDMEVHEVGPFEYHDKIPLKRGLAAQKVRVVPPDAAWLPRKCASCPPEPCATAPTSSPAWS